MRGFLEPPPAKNILSESRSFELMASDTDIEVSWVRVAINELLLNWNLSLYFSIHLILNFSKPLLLGGS